MSDSKTLSSTQIRYLRIGPKVNHSNVLKQQLINALQQQKRQAGAQFSNGIGSLNRIPKFSYGQMHRTVNNFGVLINQNFGNQSTLHQMQKFGKLAKQVDKAMQLEKDKIIQINSKKNANSRALEQTDNRTTLKSIYNYQGQKIYVVLHSFSIQVVGENLHNYLPFSIMKLLITRAGSSKLSRMIESAFHLQSDQIQVNYQKLDQKTAAFTNNQQKYQNSHYKFQKLGTQFRINLPYVQFSHIQSQFKINVMLKNKDILDILSQQFDNVHDIVYKYFDHDNFAKNMDVFGNNNNNNMEEDQSPHKQFDPNNQDSEQEMNEIENNQGQQQKLQNQVQQNQQNQQIQQQAQQKVNEQKSGLQNQNIEQQSQIKDQ